MDNTLEKVLPKITRNELILKNIFYYLDEQSIEQCLKVCQQWNIIARSVDRPKRKICQIIAVFLIDRFASFFLLRSRILKFSSPLIEKSVDEYYTISGRKGPENFENQFLQCLQKSYSRPSCLILLEGNNIKIGKKRRWKRAKVINAIRSSLPHHCAVIGIDAHYGIIGESSQSALTSAKDPLTICYEISGLFGISCLVLPKYEGFNVTVFERASEECEEEFIFQDDIKAVVLFSSGVSSKGGYLIHSQVDTIFDHFDGQLALAGAQVNDKLVTNQPTVQYFSDDTANFFFVNGPPPYNSMFNPKKMSLIGIQFSGPNCYAASLAIEDLNHLNNGTDGNVIEKELAHIESKLLEFKANLPFPSDSYGWSSESIAFLFFNYDHYKRYAEYSKDINAGVSIFHTVFPKTHITGILCHAQYEHNFIPKMDQENDFEFETGQDSPPFDNFIYENTNNGSSRILLPSPRGIASFLIININK